MKMDLYLQRKVAPYDLVSLEGIEISEELLGTWDNQRATVEIPKEMLPINLEEYKGIVRLYNTKRQGRKHPNPQSGWELMYYIPQHIYHSRTLKHITLPFLKYTHGGEDNNTILIHYYPNYDYFRMANQYYFQRGYQTRAKGFFVMHRFYIPTELSRTRIYRHFISYYDFGIDIYPDGTSIVSFWNGESYPTNIFTSGHWYIVFWYYANYSLIRSDGITIVRDDGAIFSQGTSSHWPYSNDLFGIIPSNTYSLPCEDLWVWWDTIGDGAEWDSVGTEINIHKMDYCVGELYTNSHDEQVYFAEKVVFTDEEGNEKKYLYSLELSDITAIENIVAPFSINYQENTTRDTTIFGQATHYTQARFIAGNFENRIRALIYAFGLFDARIELDYYIPVVGVENDYTWVKTPKSQWITLTDGTTLVLPLFITENEQVYIRLYRDGKHRAFMQIILLRDYGYIWQSNWYVWDTGLGYTLSIRVGKPWAVLDGAYWYLYWNIDVQGYSSSLSEPVGKSYYFRLRWNEQNTYLFPGLISTDHDTLYGHTGAPASGYSAMCVIFQSGDWRVLVVATDNWPTGNLTSFILLDRHLNFVRKIGVGATPLGAELKATMRWNTDFIDIEMDAFEIVPDTRYKIAVRGKRLTIGQIDFDAPASTMDGNLENITAIRKCRDGYGWLAGWKNGVLYWRNDLPHNSTLPQYAWYFEIGEEVQDITFIGFQANGSITRWGYVVATKSGKIYATAPNYRFQDYYPSFNQEIAIANNVFKTLANSLDTTPKGWDLFNSNEHYHAKAIRFSYPGVIYRVDFSWSGNEKAVLGVPYRETIQLWDYTYDGIGFLGLQDVYVCKTRKEQKASQYNSIQGWDYYGKQVQGHYILTFIHDWDIEDGRFVEIQAWDIQIEKIYVKQILGGGYFESVVWDYVNENDFVIVENVETAKDIIDRVEGKGRIREIMRGKTYYAVRVGDKVDVWNGNIYYGRYRIHNISADNQGVISFTAVKL